MVVLDLISNTLQFLQSWFVALTSFSHIIMLKVTADLIPVNAKKVAVKFDFFKIGGLVSILLEDPVQFSNSY